MRLIFLGIIIFFICFGFYFFAALTAGEISSGGHVRGNYSAHVIFYRDTDPIQYWASMGFLLFVESLFAFFNLIAVWKL